MTQNLTSLDQLRREIDRIDAEMHALLVKRSGLAEQVARAKGRNADIFIRPGRHAAILRRLAERHAGPFPLLSLLRLWNEIIGPMTELQGPLAMGVYTPAGGIGLLDTAREFYGSYTPARACPGTDGVLDHVESGAVTMGILPLPGEGPPWWPALIRRPLLNVVARLPFLGDAWPALVVARMAPEASGDDRTLLAVRAADVETALAMARTLSADGDGLACQCVDRVTDDGETWHLVDVTGFVGLDSLPDGDDGIAVIGSYPVPLDLDRNAPMKECKEAK